MKTGVKHNKANHGIMANGNPDLEFNIVDVKKKSVFVKQDFEVMDDRILDSKGRVTISLNWIPNSLQPVRSFKIFRNGDGDLLLRPEVSIPAREAWVFQNPKVLASLQKGIKELEGGKGDIVDNLDSYLNKL